jgi:restriction endonuclease S subunit
MSEANTSQNVISVKIARERINPFYLFAYLVSSHGQTIMQQIQAAQVQPKLELYEVRDFPVPVFGSYLINTAGR